MNNKWYKLVFIGQLITFATPLLLFIPIVAYLSAITSIFGLVLIIAGLIKLKNVNKHYKTALVCLIIFAVLGFISFVSIIYGLVYIIMFANEILTAEQFAIIAVICLLVICLFLLISTINFLIGLKEEKPELKEKINNVLIVTVVSYPSTVVCCILAKILEAPYNFIIILLGLCIVVFADIYNFIFYIKALKNNTNVEDDQYTINNEDF